MSTGGFVMVLGRVVRGCCIAATALGVTLLLVPDAAKAAPGWAPTADFPVPATDVLLGTPSAADELAYQNGGTVNEAFLQVESGAPLETTLHVGTMPPGGAYADQLTIASTETAVPASAAIAVAPDGAAVVAWRELTGPDEKTATFRYRAAYRPAGSSTWEAPVTLATDAELSKEVAPSVVPVIGPGGTAAVAVVHYTGELGELRKEQVGRLDVAVRIAGGWVPAVRISAAKVSAESPVLSTDAEGNVTVAFQSRFNEGASSEHADDENQTVVRRRSAGSGSWGPAEDITPAVPGHESFPAQLGEDEAGDAALAFQYDETLGKFQTTLVTRRGASGAWTALTQPDTTGSASGPVGAGVAPDGTAYVLYWWFGPVSTAEDCEGAVRGATGGAVFTSHRCVSPVGQETQNGSLALLGDDAYFAWRGNVPGKGSVDTVQGARWAGANALPDAATDFDPEGLPYSAPNITSDRQGSAVAFYANSEPGVLRAAPYDGGPPIVRAASVPASAVAGQSVPFSANLFDLWSALGAGQPTWSFGDGSAPASGSAVAHTFAAPGTYTLTVDAADTLGNATSSTYTLTVAAPPSSSHPTPPVISEARASASRFRAGRRAAHLSAGKKRPPVGTTFSFRLNEAASVSFTFTERAKGVKVGKRCLAKAPKGRRGRSCTRTVAAGSLALAGHAGLDKVSFQGRISVSKRLKPGRYTLRIVATNAMGERSAPATLTFTIIR